MTKAAFTAALLIALAAPLSQAQGACEASDLRGRWGYYGIGDIFGVASTADCAFLVNRIGSFARVEH
jgi:hypothetical protein